MSHWKYMGESVSEPPEGAYGFVYMLTNTLDKRRYIGRKYFYTSRKKPLTKRQKSAGRVRSTRIHKESDWKEYCGSSDVLLQDIDKLGKDKFTFEILAYGYTKGQVNYLEENLQHKYDVLTDDKFYNNSIGSRKFVSMSVTPELINELKKVDKKLG